MTDDGARPDPDALLARVQAEAEPPRARLKIFFGAAPGVGKTFAMLESARRLRADGADVVVGVVETHGRSETRALLDGLEVLPRRGIEHRGVRLDELDLEGALARRPEIILIDELAHTNAPGSRHLKRWQDVLDLLDAGIEVHATLNVQHVESLSDVVQQITGIKVRETVPDHLLERADELELIDLAPDALLERLAEGKVYLGDAAARAAQNFFHKGNLHALRELSLRRTAERVDVEVQAYRKAHGIARPWAASERILVGVGASPSSKRLIRAGRRTAERLDASWEVAFVERPGRPLGERDRDRVDAHLRLAESLGAEVVRLRGDRVAVALLEHARARNVTRILAGKPTHPRWRDVLRGSMLDELIRHSGEIEIHVVSPIEAGPAPAATTVKAGSSPPASPWAYASAAAGVCAVTALGLAAFDYLTQADLAMLYLVTIMLASLAGRGPSILAASLAVASFDFCFVPPRFTFAVSDLRYFLTFGVMFGAGLAISTLTGRLRRQERDAVERERRTAALLAFSRDIGAADNVADIAAALATHVEQIMGVAASVLVPDGDELIAVAGLMPLASAEESVARWSFDHGQPAGHGTATLPGAAVTAIPLRPGDDTLGVLVVAGPRGARGFDVERRHLIEALARQAGIAVAGARHGEDAREATVRARTEELRSSLLSAVSHDLRTPLAAITGSATTLRDDGARLPAATRAELLDTIVDEAGRLERVLQNLLGITRVEAGLEPAREWVPVVELCGPTLARLSEQIGDRAVTIDIPPELLVPVDPLLFEHVMINLIENALKHGAAPVRIAARADGDTVVLEVSDSGPGLVPGTEARAFEKFFRAPGTRTAGVGLGLAVVRGIIEAHGGTITVDRDRALGGAHFRIVLPAANPPTVAEPPRALDSVAAR